MRRAIVLLLVTALCFFTAACGLPERVYVYYTVTFDAQGGSAVESARVMDGNPVRRPETPLRDGYFLNGWYTAPSTSDETEWNFDTDRVRADLTLYAGWTPADAQEPTSGLLYQLEGDAYTVTGLEGEETVLIVPAVYNDLPVTKIQGAYGTGAFARRALTKVTLPDSLVEIGQNSFHNCSQLVDVHIGTGSRLAVIGNNAFSGNSALREFYLPTGAVQLGDAIFNNCGALERFIVAEDNAAYRAENGHLIETATATLIRGGGQEIVPEGVAVLAQAAFRRSHLTRLELPASLTQIQNYVIQGSAIEEVVFRGSEQQWAQVEKAALWNMGKTELAVDFAPQEEVSYMYATIGGNRLEVTLVENSSVAALVALLRQGDITYTANDYGGFEKVGDLGHTLPRNDEQISVGPGDVILYQGTSLCFYYSTNAWNFTRIGRIEGYTDGELRTLLGAGSGSVQITLSLD